MVTGYTVTNERYVEENWDEVDQKFQNEEREYKIVFNVVS